MEQDQARKYLHELLTLMLRQGGSDLFLTAGFPPAVKVDGRLARLGPQALTPPHTTQLGQALMGPRQADEFERTQECNFAIAPEGLGRFRVNAFRQRGHVGLVLRAIPTEPPSIDALGLPPVLKDIAMAPRGLVVLVGATGSGKSTTLAALLDWRNTHSQGHIVTVEDPIEFVHPHRHCIVTQREVGLDTESWEAALRNALRQAPDVIAMGEIRDRQAMEQALAFAETGHLCLATMHAGNAQQAIERVQGFFPADRRTQLQMDLGLNLRALVSQRLLPRSSGRGRIAAVEVLLNTPLVTEMLFKGDTPGLREAMNRSHDAGMQTFDKALFDLHERGLVTAEDALRQADSAHELRLRLKLHGRRASPQDPAADAANLTVI